MIGIASDHGGFDLKEKISQYGVKDNLKKYYSIINNLLILLEEMHYEK